MRTALATIVAAASCVASIPAGAEVYGDDLAKCLVSHTSDQEKTGLMQFVFAAMSAHPAVASMAKVTPGQRQALSKQFAQLTQQLVAVRCRTETVAALKAEGVSAIEASFRVLGQVAMRGLMTDAAVAAEFQQLGSYFDQKAMVDLFKEAGITKPATPATTK